MCSKMHGYGENQKVHQVIIVGGGICGLSAARTLASNGIQDILILEAKDELGGRAKTIPFGTGIIEAGAQWIHGQANEVYKLAQEFGMLHSNQSLEGQGEFRTSNGALISTEIVDKVIETVNGHLNYIENNVQIDHFGSNGFKRPEFTSIGSFLHGKFAQEVVHTNSKLDDDEKAVKQAIWQWKINWEKADNSCNDLNQLSLFRWGEFKENEGEPYNNFLQGAQQFVNSLINPFPSIKVRLSCPIIKIQWSQSNFISVTSKCQDVENDKLITTLSARVVLVTVPIGVLKAEPTLFEPLLPSHISNAINCIGFDSITKLFLEYEQPWWNTKEFQGIQFLWPNYGTHENKDDTKEYGFSDSDWIKALSGFDPILDNPNVLLSWVGGKEAVLLETLDNHVIAIECTRALRMFTNDDTIPFPKRVFVSKWCNDCYCRGAYSYRTVETNHIHGDITKVLTQPVQMNLNNNENETRDGNFVSNIPMLLLAGEAMHLTQYSTLTGAYESGKAQAQTIIKYFQCY